jgi:hypothetical protein
VMKYNNRGDYKGGIFYLLDKIEAKLSTKA